MLRHAVLVAPCAVLRHARVGMGKKKDRKARGAKDGEKDAPRENNMKNDPALV